MPSPKSKFESDVPASDSSIRSALDRAAHHARAYLATLDGGAVAATVSRQELLSRLDVPLTPEAVAADVVVDELAARAMRVSVVNWRTTPADVDRTVAAVARAIADDAHAV